MSLIIKFFPSCQYKFPFLVRETNKYMHVCQTNRFDKASCEKIRNEGIRSLKLYQNVPFSNIKMSSLLYGFS